MDQTGRTKDSDIYAKQKQVVDDVRKLIDREIRRIESKRKVPLQPCKCGRKHIEQWHKYIAGEGREGFIYQCICGAEGKVKRTDNEARLAWNEMMEEVK